MKEDSRVEIELGAREQRLYDRLRAQVRPVTSGAGSDLRDVLLAFPDLVMLLVRLLRDPRVAVGDKAVALFGVAYVLSPLDDPRVAVGDKAVALFGVAYVLSPLDLMPVWLFGPLGALDDVLVVAATLSRVVNHVHPDVVRSHWSGQGDALRLIQRATDWSEETVGKRLRGALRRILP